MNLADKHIFVAAGRGLVGAGGMKKPQSTPDLSRFEVLDEAMAEVLRRKTPAEPMGVLP